MGEQAEQSVITSHDVASSAASREEVVANVVEFIIGLLEQAARGQHTAWALSEAMASIMARHARRADLRPSHRQQDRLLAAINSVYLTAGRILPPLCRPSLIHTGMGALADIVAYCAADDEQRAAWNPDAYRDTFAYARIFRNMLHNISLAEEIEDRRAKRRAQTIASILSQACDVTYTN